MNGHGLETQIFRYGRFNYTESPTTNEDFRLDCGVPDRYHFWPVLAPGIVLFVDTFGSCPCTNSYQ